MDAAAASSVPTAALLAGATGLVGRALAQAWPGPGPLHLLVRRPLPATWAQAHPMHRVHVVDFAALPPLPAAEVALCALGTTIKTAGSPEAFRAVDHGAVLAFARAARRAGVRHFGVVSALGADAGSRVFYNRVKGEAEAELQTLGFTGLVIARPSLLLGDRAALGQPLRPLERLAAGTLAPLARWVPATWRPIGAEAVARALLGAVLERQGGVRVLESAELARRGG